MKTGVWAVGIRELRIVPEPWGTRHNPPYPIPNPHYLQSIKLKLNKK